MVTVNLNPNDPIDVWQGNFHHGQWNATECHLYGWKSDGVLRTVSSWLILT